MSALRSKPVMKAASPAAPTILWYLRNGQRYQIDIRRTLRCGPKQSSVGRGSEEIIRVSRDGCVFSLRKGATSNLTEDVSLNWFVPRSRLCHCAVIVKFSKVTHRRRRNHGPQSRRRRMSFERTKLWGAWDKTRDMSDRVMNTHLGFGRRAHHIQLGWGST